MTGEPPRSPVPNASNGRGAGPETVTHAGANILTGADVIDAMATATAQALGHLAARMLPAMLAGYQAGGDRRGKQSAAIHIAREGGGHLGDSDVAVDLRVDDHQDPVGEMGRLREIHRPLFTNPEGLEFIEIDDPLTARLATALTAAGRPTESRSYDNSLKQPSSPG